LNGVLQQRGFADARLAMNDQDRAAAATGRLEQFFEQVALTAAANKVRPARARD